MIDVDGSAHTYSHIAAIVGVAEVLCICREVEGLSQLEAISTVLINLELCIFRDAAVQIFSIGSHRGVIASGRDRSGHRASELIEVQAEAGLEEKEDEGEESD